ncbi:MAG: S41 family peptidase [Pirellulaceae bacterium]|nr:S41 family peptidase [Pirellulaceae bacterium]
MTLPPSALTRSLACFLTLVLLSWPAVATAQVANSTEPLPNPVSAESGRGQFPTSLAEVEQLLQLGEKFEQEQRWSDALLHYEQAIKSYPESPQLEQRLTLARVHYDLARRYHDTSYLDVLQTMKPQEALDVYTEVLLKIHSHYVSEPDWQELVRLGSVQLDVALSQPLFVQKNLPAASSQDVAAFRSELSRLVAGSQVRDRHSARQLVFQVAQSAERRLQLAPTAVILEFTSGATSALDMYSAFLTPHQLDDLFSQIEGNFVGLGVELKLEPRELLVVHVIPGGPAAQAGILSGDRIVAVNGHSTETLGSEGAADRLKGPEGSTVQVTIRRADAADLVVQVTRKRVEVPSVDGARLLDPQLGVAYLRLTSFQKTTSRDVDTALWSLYRQGMRILIMDLRGNPGGLLNAAVEVADKFVTDGTLVSTRGRSRREDFDYQAHRVGTWRVPLIVLIDGDSASASEIFAAAIQDHGRGTVVGQRSYGKGSVQGIFPLNSSRAGVRLTTAKFYAPSGRPISLQGVQPHVAVQVAAKPVADGQPQPPDQPDATLESAVRVARQQVARRP